jgi:epoxyqueuosine reductase
MDYMRDNLDKRTNPAKLFKNAQSIICLGLNYTPPKTQKKATTPAGPMGTVANYARYEDYHPFIKKQLRKLTDFIASSAGTGFRFKICVDSAPLAERTLAARAGLGFIGKNRMLINPELGPQIFLAEIVTSLKLPADEPIKADCSNCNKCLNACPTGALMPDGHFDANKCISYLTIEYKAEFPPDLARKIGARLFGCDECVLACPHQANAPLCKNRQFKFYNDRAKLNLNEILNMSEDDFETKFADSAFIRLGLDRLKRNAQTCLTNLRPS